MKNKQFVAKQRVTVTLTEAQAADLNDFVDRYQRMSPEVGLWLGESSFAVMLAVKFGTLHFAEKHKDV